MAEKAKKVRLDELVAARGLAESRSLARRLIMAGKVRSGGHALDKPGKTYPEDIELELLQPPRFVSRGAEKLEGFLERFPVAIEGRLVFDIGASTGGFTDCLLQRGAAKAVCVDVGRNQLHPRLLADPRVHNIEKLNARHMSPDDLPCPDCDIAVMDLSFISLTQALPSVWPLVRPGGVLICLIKPQFEADKRDADKGKGVIRDPAVREKAVERVRACCRETLACSEEFGFCESPIHGADGNVEYLLGLRKAR